jgi:uroporphyrinogen-III synthase
VTALVSAIAAEQTKGPLLYVRGRDSAGDLAKTLISLGVMVDELVVYEQQATPLNTAAEALLAEGRSVIAPVFSPRTAGLLAGEPAVLGRVAPLWIVALSRAVADEGAGAGAEKTICAARPDADAMLDAIAELLATASLP